MAIVEEVFGVTEEELRAILENEWERYYEKQKALHEAKRKELNDNTTD